MTCDTRAPRCWCTCGANVKAVQRQMGHKSAAMTLDVYADLFDADLDAVAEAMNGLLVKAIGEGRSLAA